MLKLLIAIASVYLGLMALLYYNQRALLYHPSKRGLTTTEAEALSLTKWPVEDGYRGYLSDPQNAEQTIVVFHGNAAEAATRAYYPAALAATNSRIILAEYPGYGSRPGTPSEELYVSDARTTLLLAARQFPDQPLFVIGESMGCGVASAAVARSQSGPGKQTVDGMILITPWDSFVNLAQAHYRFLPARWLVLDRYDSVKNLQHFDAPIAVVLAGKDRIVPVKHGNILFDSIRFRKARFMLEAASHNDWLDHVDGQWWQELMSFLSSDTNTAPRIR